MPALQKHKYTLLTCIDSIYTIHRSNTFRRTMHPTIHRLKSRRIASWAILKRPRITAAALFLALLMLVAITTPQNATGRPEGIIITNVEGGCFCHGPNPSSDVGGSDTLVLPDNYTIGETYLIDINFTDAGPSAQTGSPQGGFYLEVNSGTLASIDSNVIVTDGNKAIHSTEGNGKRNWTLKWTADADPTVFILLVNSVNGDSPGDNDGSGGDMWNKITVTYNSDGTTGIKLAEKGWEAPEKMLEWELTLVLLCLAGITGYTMRKVTRGRRRE